MDKQTLKENCCKLVNTEFLTPLEERPVALKPDFYLHALGRTSPIDFKSLHESETPSPEKKNEKPTNVPKPDVVIKPLTSIEFDEDKFLREEENKRRNKLNNIKGILKK
ncbi:Hypothetical protein SRAE_2000043700 [Strongyloides ratti]|uniref:Uncharacterized protein n=1 Tax=Strongyloides ratti TaxID=34506 RepID=A0A090L7K4_STRRB|nr:Hypothetical protein SRAE_2000043700 [Strongyloides ratti]CEF65761.1 Hypothetical protein SRAE_2000043700 [Strongyloides ratti]